LVGALLGLALAQERLGDPSAALALTQRARGIQEALSGEDAVETAHLAMRQGDLHSAVAQYDKALPLLERAIGIYERQLAPDDPTLRRGLNNLASAYARLGQHERALRIRIRAAEMAEKRVGPEHLDLMVVLNNLAQTYSALGQLDKALPLQVRVLSTREKVLGSDHPGTATALNNLSQVRFARGEYAESLDLQQRALATREKVLGAQHPDTASSLNNLATIHRALNRPAEALPFQQRALAAYEATLGPDHPNTATALTGLAQLHLGLGDLPLGIAMLKQAVNVQQAMREQAARIDAAALRSYTASVSNFYQQLASALSDEGRLPEAQLVLDMLKEEEQFEFVRRQPGTAPGSTRLGFNATEQAWAERYRQISGRLAALGAEQQALERASRAPGATLTPEQRQRRQTLAADLAVARTAFESFLKDMRADFAAKGAARTVELTEAGTQALQALRALLQGLGGDSVLLQLYLTDDRVHFLLTTPGVQLARSVSVSATELNRQIGQFRRLLRDPRSDPLPAAQALYRLLIAPVAQDLEQAGARTVMLSLDGALRYLPFGALHDGQRYLLQRWNLPIYTSVTRDRLRDAVTPAWRAAGLGVTRQIGSFDALPGVRAEMSRIIQQPGTAPATPAAMPGEVHLDEQFTARKLMEVSRAGFSVMHLASHFRFSPGTEANSFLLLGDGQQLTLGEMRQQNLRFDQTELLTLSACETGLGGGRDERGQEIEGFGVLAQQQGARAVLATLWAVADQSTAALMAETYRQREAQRLSKIEALRQAQLALQREPNYAHPFYWAPFILMGNWK
jgi:CHAT domain-containing protein